MNYDNLFKSKHNGPSFVSRRRFLQNAGGGIGGLALAYLLGGENFALANSSSNLNPLAPKAPMLTPKVKRVISIFCFGGLSHIDSFDFKSELVKKDGISVAGRPEFDTMGRSAPGKLMKSPWNFKPAGQSGHLVSDLFPNIAGCMDDIALIRSMVSDSNNHVPALYHMLTGSILAGRPGLGSWITYGLGTENQNLPAFVVMTDPRALVGGGVANWNSAFLPSNYQGVQFRSGGLPVLNLKPPADLSPERQKQNIQFIEKLNDSFLRDHPGEQDMAARIQTYELAFRMQTEATEAVDVSRETVATRNLYGMDKPETETFGKQCLLARRLVERGVRFVQLYSGGGVFDQSWDAHNAIIPNHTQHAREIDQPIAGLLKDLKQRGLFEDTLVVFHTEFGRMPFTEGAVGRDHNPHAFSCWLAGGGVKGGVVHGESDEIGYKVATDPHPVHDLNATILYLLGLDHLKLTYFYNGRNMRLTDVYGNVIPQVLA